MNAEGDPLFDHFAEEYELHASDGAYNALYPSPGRSRAPR